MVGAGHHDHCITGGVMSKFGIMGLEAVEVYSLAKKLGFTPVGMHSHIRQPHFCKFYSFINVNN